MLRDDQIGLLRWVLAAVDDGTEHDPGSPPALDLGRLRAAGLATGLTAAVGALAERRGAALPPACQHFVDEQRVAVAARCRRYRTLLPEVLAALGAAGVGAVPVKGAVLADLVWPVPDARPMADIDVIVRPAERERAVRALLAAGLAHAHRAADEDVLLAWGDGSRTVTDRESEAHSGKVEVHPGWRQEVHHYAVDDGGWLLAATVPGTVAGVTCRVLPEPALALHTLGHLSAGVIRAEVRALNVVDVALLLARLGAADGAAFAAGCAALDPRLTAPGLWLVRSVRPVWLDPPFDLDATVARELRRLPVGGARRLAAADPASVLRELGTRTRLDWRLAFTTTPRERTAVVRQAVVPPSRDLAVEAPGQSIWRLQAHRAVRSGQRLRARLARS